MTVLTNLLPGLGNGHPNIRTRYCRGWRLKLCLRPSPSQPSRRYALRGLSTQKSAGTRVAGHSIPDRPEPALRQARLTTGSSPADPPRQAFSAHRVRRTRGFFLPSPARTLRPNQSAQSVFLAIPAPRLAAGFGVRTVPAVPTLALRLRPACACCPDLRRRYLSKTAAARPGPPWVFPAGSPTLAGRRLSRSDEIAP